MVGYQPKPEDLDYPAKLQRLADTGTPKALPAAPSELVVEATRDDDVRNCPPLMNPAQITPFLCSPGYGLS